MIVPFPTVSLSTAPLPVVLHSRHERPPRSTHTIAPRSDTECRCSTVRRPPHSPPQSPLTTSPTTSAAFAGKLTSAGVLNSRRTQHSPQRQRLRWRRCGGGSGVIEGPIECTAPSRHPRVAFRTHHIHRAAAGLTPPDQLPPSPAMAPAFPQLPHP